MDKTTQIVFIVFTAAILISVLIQTAAAVAVLVAARKAQTRAQALVEELRGHALPALRTSNALLEDLAPKLKLLASNLVEATEHIKAVSQEVGSVVSDVSKQTRARVAHVNGMIDGTLDQITHTTNTIQHKISVPVRQLTGVLNGVRAALNVMREKPSRASAGAEETEEDDLFV